MNRSDAVAKRVRPVGRVRRPQLTQPQRDTTIETQPARVTGTAYFSADLMARRRLFDYLEMSYVGGVAYKDAADAMGLPVLVEHEAETTRVDADPTLMVQSTISGASQASGYKNRYFRRKRLAAYDNHFKPVVDKIHAYLTRTTPVRVEDEAAQEDFARTDFNNKISEFLLDSLKFNEAWIGFDAAQMDPSEVRTVMQATQADPKNNGKAYIVIVDPRRVVDFDEVDGRVCRLVIEEVEVSKASLLTQPTMTIRYREWTDTDWKVYQRDDANETTAMPIATINGTSVTMVDFGTHGFACCPFFRMRPRFPTVDIAELNRAIFNQNSLLDEELYGNTFSQIVITGARTESVAKSQRGVGNAMVLEEDTARVAVLGSDTSQSAAILERLAALRDSLYALVSMEPTAKNVAESAEKKKRDLESLYTLLLGVANDLERVDNMLAMGMGIIPADEPTSLTKYDKRFDIATLSELRDELSHAFETAMFPASYRRRLILAYIGKTDPFGDQQVYSDDVAKQIDLTPARITAIRELIDANAITPEMVADALAVPDKDRASFITMFKSRDHSGTQEDLNAEADRQDNADPDEPPADDQRTGDDKPTGDAKPEPTGRRSAKRPRVPARDR